MANFQIEKYSVVILRHRAQVILYADDDISRSTRRVVIDLQPNSQPAVDDQGTTIVAQMDLEMLAPLVDLLRNEDPTHVVWWPTHAYVYAGPEPAGEGEMQQPDN